MIGLKELELRLLDDKDRIILVIPIISSDREDALLAARAHMQANGAANFTLVPQLSSAGYRRVDVQ
jgi:hypothetical protein